MSIKSFTAIASGILAAFVLSACSESPEEKTKRLQEEVRQQQVMAAAKDRIDRVQNRFHWDVSKRSCYLTDKTDGTKYKVYRDGTANTSEGPAEFLKQGAVDRSKRRCYITDFKEKVYCISNRSDEPVCTPFELLSEGQRSRLGLNLINN